MSAPTTKFPAATNKASRGIEKAGKASKSATKQVNGLTRSVQGLVTAAALIGATRFVFANTAELETQTRSLKVLTGELETAQKIVASLQQFASVTPFTSTELIETSKRLAAFGVETEALVNTTKRLADVSGATGAELNGVATAYGQIVAKGRLQGEVQLLQLQERGIGIQEELQKMYGLTGDEFRKALEKGRISSEAVELALKNLTSTGGKYADGAIAQSDTLAGRLSTLQDSIQRLAQNVGRILTPLFEWVINSSIDAINYINQLANQAAKIQGFGIDDQTRDSYWKKAGEEAEELIRLRGELDAMGNPDSKAFTTLRNERFEDMLNQYGYDNGKLQVEIEPVKAPGALTIPELLGGGTESGGSKAAAANTKAADEMERQLKAGEDLSRQFSRQIKLLQTKGKYDKELLRNQFELEDAIRRINETAAPLQREGLIGEAAMAKDLQDVRTLEEAIEGLAGDVANDYTEALKESNAELTQGEELLKGAYEIVSGTLTNSIQGLIDGTKEWGDVLSDIASQLGNMFLQAGFSALGGGLGIPGFADGGRPSVGEVSVVGERGPELFIPDSPGRVVPNNQSQAAMAQFNPGNESGGSGGANERQHELQRANNAI